MSARLLAESRLHFSGLINAAPAQPDQQIAAFFLLLHAAFATGIPFLHSCPVFPAGTPSEATFESARLHQEVGCSLHIAGGDALGLLPRVRKIPLRRRRGSGDRRSRTGGDAARQRDGHARQSGKVAALRVNDPIFERDTLVTGPDAALGITFDDQTIFSLSANSRIVVDASSIKRAAPAMPRPSTWRSARLCLLRAWLPRPAT